MSERQAVDRTTARSTHPRRTPAMNESVVVSRWRLLAPYLLSLLRIVAAFLFIQVGTAKIFAFPAAIMPGGGTAPVGSLAWIAGFLEAFGGAFLLVGLFTRTVSFLLSGEMAFAYFIGHAPQGLWPVLNQGTDAALYAFLFLYFSAAGPGPGSLDALFFRKRGRVDFGLPRSTSE
jgi:putative oxidoreductase